MYLQELRGPWAYEIDSGYSLSVLDGGGVSCFPISGRGIECDWERLTEAVEATVNAEQRKLKWDRVEFIPPCHRNAWSPYRHLSFCFFSKRYSVAIGSTCPDQGCTLYPKRFVSRRYVERRNTAQNSMDPWAILWM